MSDRTSAGLFAEIFELIDEHVKDTVLRNELAHRFWSLTHDYDFSPYQMDCNEALESLGLARQIIDDYGDPTWEYGVES